MMVEKMKPHTLATPDGWWVGSSDEYLNIGGPFSTREEAIAEGRQDCGDDPFYICFAGLHHWAAPNAETVIEDWVDRSDDLWFDDGFPGFSGPDAKEKERAATNDLQTVLNDWFHRHHEMLPTPTAFAFHRDGEWFNLPEKVAAGDDPQ